jgi:hypothetical protein
MQLANFCKAACCRAGRLLFFLCYFLPKESLRLMKKFQLRTLCALAAALLLAVYTHTASAATLTGVTFDTDSYIFIGTNNEFDQGVSLSSDYSGGVLHADNTHVIFGLMKFGDLTGLQTVANGGPSKFLTVKTLNPGTATYAVSVAGADVINGYPSTSGSFNGPAGTATDRLQWYFDNIKGDDASYGGYAGGADHVGVFNFSGGPNTYSLDVTAAVDAWIDGTVPNHGFGLWAVTSPGGLGAPFDLASRENTSVVGSRLTDVSVPEPASMALVLVGLAGSLCVRRRFRGAARLLSLVTVIVALGAASNGASSAQAATIAPTEDVMTSSFFTSGNYVRGYAGESRPTFRVSSHEPTSLAGAETIYLKFNTSDFASYTSPVASAILTMTSVAGGFGFDASASSPFTVSAHGVNADPFTSITDDTNPGGSISWLDFYGNNILPASVAASTVVNGLGQFSFDVTSVVNSWVAGSNTQFYLALTGKNDTSGNTFLHGFKNNNDTVDSLGSTFLTVTAVPEPTALALCALGLCGVAAIGGRRVRSIA